MRSEVAKWIDSWPLWERKVARGILSQELTQPLWENDGDSGQSDETVEYSREQREREKRATVRGSKEPLRGDDAESEQQGEGSETSKNTLENIPRGF